MTDCSYLLKDKLCYQIVKFFKENPFSVETISGIAKWIGEDKTNTGKAVNKLVQAGILVKHKSVGIVGYGLTQDERINKELNKYYKK